jgi:hypothetical protein
MELARQCGWLAGAPISSGYDPRRRWEETPINGTTSVKCGLDLLGATSVKRGLDLLGSAWHRGSAALMMSSNIDELATRRSSSLDLLRR